MADVFFSYASEDRARAESLVAVLEHRGWSVWWDRKIPTGEDYQRYIKEKLDSARCVIVLWSEHSTASNWVRAEANSAFDRRILVPASINGVEPPIPFNTIQTARLADWDGTSAHPELDRLLAAVAERLGAPHVPPEKPAPWRPTWKHWLAAGVVTAHVGAALALVFVRVSSTEVRLDLHMAEVGFTSSAQQPLITSPMGLAMLGASGLARIDLPRAVEPGSRPIHASSLLLTAERDGAVQLEPFSVPAGTRLALRRTDIPDEYRLSLEGALPDLGASVEGPVRAVVPQVLTQAMDLAHPKIVALRPDSGVVDLDFQVAAGQPSTLSPRLAVNDLRLYRIERHEGEFVAVSTILSGRLFFVTLDKEGPGFTEGEALRFTRTEGEAQGLQPAGEHVALTFAGRVRGMSMGSGELRKNLMPTWLEWLQAHRSLKLLAQVYLGLLTVTAGGIRWWKNVVAWARRA